MEDLEYLSENPVSASVDNLYPALTQCFAVILCGYFAGRMNWITETEAKGMNVFVGTFSLPSLIFMSLLKLNLNSVNWTFLLAIFLSKTLVFCSVVVVATLVTRPLKLLGRAGIFAIFCTQSNDFAIGYPLVEAVYSTTHPDYVSYIYLVAPINLAILNPLAFILLELERQKASALETTSRIKSVVGVVKNIFLNPIVAMTLLGVLANFTMRRDIPVYLANFLETLGSAFSASALFLLGVRMVGKVHTLKGATLMIPGILIMVKLIVLPLVTREVVSLLNAGTNATDTTDLSTFGFLYGTFPSAPAVFVFATQYGVDVDLVASSMVACTFLSAPLMFISAKMIEFSGTTPTIDYRRQLDAFSMNLGVAGGVACIWCLVVFGISKKWKKTPHNITMCMLVSQLMACIGVVTWYVTMISQDTETSPPSWTHYVIFSIFASGVYGARIWTAILSVTLLFLQCRGLCYVTKLMPVFLFLGFGFPVFLSGALVAIGGRTMTTSDVENLNFMYGKLEAVVSVTLLVLCFIVTCGCLILHQRYHRKFQGYRDVIREINDRLEPSTSNNVNDTVSNGTKCLSTIEENSPEIEDLFSPRRTSSSYLICHSRSFGCDSGRNNNKMAAQCRKLRRHVQDKNEREDEEEDELQDEEGRMNNEEDDEEEEEFEEGHDPQIVRHIVLLVLLLCSMFVGLALCVWTLMSRRLIHSTSPSFSTIPSPTTGGIYVELSFLDAALNFGQSVIILASFGLEGVTTPRLVRFWRRLLYGDGEILILPRVTELSDVTRKTCERFRKYHEMNCRRDIARNRRWRFKTYQDSFSGHLLVDWLINVGLADGRGHATVLSRHLVDGRIIKHVTDTYHFYDSNLLYRLTDNSEN